MPINCTYFLHSFLIVGHNYKLTSEVSHFSPEVGRHAPFTLVCRKTRRRSKTSFSYWTKDNGNKGNGSLILQLKLLKYQVVFNRIQLEYLGN